MTSKTLLTACLVAGALMLPAIGYSEDGDSDRSHPKAFAKDSVITTKIKTRLAREKLSSMVHIKVDTDNKGAVSLSGNARSQKDIDRAVSIARRTKGVKSVDNTISVKADD